MTPEQAEQLVGSMVLVGSREAGRPHTAKLLAVRGNKAEVQPGGHRGTDTVPLDKIKPWVKGNHEMIARQQKRHMRTREVAPGDPNFVNAAELLKIAKRDDLAITTIYNWINRGDIPEDATFKAPNGTRLFDVSQLRATGFFDKVAKAVCRSRKPPRDGRPAGVRPEVWGKPALPPVVPPAPPVEPPPAPPSATTASAKLPIEPRPGMTEAKAKLAAAMRNRATAESFLHEARGQEALALVEYEIARLETAT